MCRLLGLEWLSPTRRAYNKVPRENGRVKNTSNRPGILLDIGDRECIKQVIDITKPEVVIPIHTEVPEAIKELTDKAVILKDMEIYEVKERNNMIDEEIITFAEVKRRIQGKKLEELTKEEFASRYIMYGSERELKQPKIQKQFIKHGYIGELTDMAILITNKQVIQQILQSNLFENKNIILKRGSLEKISFEHFTDLKDVVVSEFTFKDTNGEEIKLNGHVFSTSNIKHIREYREEISEYRKNIIVLLENLRNKVYLRCFLKVYEDIDYNIQ